MAQERFFLRVSIESLLIVFSVLLALFLNEAWNRRSERAATEEQLGSIRLELADNQRILADWLERHEAIAANMAALRETEPDEPLVVDGKLDIGRVFGRSLADTMVRDTAWETAKTTGLVRHFDLRCANLLTDLYGLQEVIERQIWKIAGMLQEREAHEAEHLPQTLALLEVSMQELQGQEHLLASAYREALSQLDRDGCAR